MGGDAPTPPDYLGLAREQGQQQRETLAEQTAANRPNQYTPYATSLWAQGPNGEWIQSTNFAGPLYGLNQNLQQQAYDAMGQPLDFSALPELTSGDAAREQAINAAYGQASSRLDPRFGRQRESLRSQLLAQGLQPGSEAYDQAMRELGMTETDAYNQALFSAQREGTAAGQALFGQSQARRNQMLSELLRQRSQPLQEMQQLSGFLGQPNVMQAGRAGTPDLMGALGQQYGAELQKYLSDQARLSEYIQAGASLAATAAYACDERVKEDVARLPVEALPGVPLATWRYRDGYGPPGQHVGVIAQDLRRVVPEAVTAGPDGVLYVSPTFAPRRLSHG